MLLSAKRNHLAIVGISQYAYIKRVIPLLVFLVNDKNRTEIVNTM
jgi:hypothetical protein